MYIHETLGKKYEKNQIIKNEKINGLHTST